MASIRRLKTTVIQKRQRKTKMQTKFIFHRKDSSLSSHKPNRTSNPKKKRLGKLLQNNNLVEARSPRRQLIKQRSNNL